MKHSYEIPVVFRVMPDDETQQAIDQVIAWLENSNEIENAGSVTRIDRTRLGRRRLAYEIKGQRDGFYVLIYATVDPSHLPEFELNIRLYDPVLRYMIVRDEAFASQSEPSDESEELAEEVEETETTDEETSADEADTSDSADDDESEDDE